MRNENALHLDFRTVLLSHCRVLHVDKRRSGREGEDQIVIHVLEEYNNNLYFFRDFILLVYTHNESMLKSLIFLNM